MLGISVYIGQQSLEDQWQYLKEMKEAGFTSVFTSLHIPEDDHSLYSGLLKELAVQTRKLDMELMADLSPASLKALGIDLGDIQSLAEWGLTGVRIDYGLKSEIIVELSKKMKVALNASTLDPVFLQRLKWMGLNKEHIEAWHNFYPRPETGLDRDYFIEKNKWLKSAGLTVMAFIPGDVLRGPLYKRLPTLEEHRDASSFYAYLDLMDCYVDKIVIGDRGLFESSLQQFKGKREGSIPLRCSILTQDAASKKMILQVHKSRMDPSRDVVRSETSRMYAMPGQQIIRENTVVRQRGSITLDNDHYGRYSGELQLAKKDLPADPKVNVVGHILDEDLGLLEKIGPGCSFSLVPSKRH
ncbi:DUF871 domain-containing protein [Bacillus testis]|uniref:DUF871 domain-containing protein n=1 Tax=Bacillus testis TaxID=1622072 RepID=UPI00067EBBE7|nr:MupG family TIM beta-alpha barrel fold protein [Bacillus testis]